MRIILPVVIALMGLMGCSRYQYAVIKSTTGVDSTGLTIHENDSLRISYAFSGRHGAAYLQIYNKLNVPLYINWSKSEVVLNDQVSAGIRKNTIAINAGPSDHEGNISDNKIRWHREMSSSPDSVEHTWLQTVTAVPSKSQVKSDIIFLGNKFFEQRRSDMMTRSQDGEVVKYRAYKQSESPFRFRSNVAVSLSSDLSDSTVITNDFWVSEVSVTGVKPSQMSSYSGKANVYFVKKPTVATEVVSGALILGSVIFLTVNVISSD